MLEALNKIIRGCYEVYFGTAIAGLVFYTLQSCRKNRKILLWLLLLLIGMMGWRFCVPNFYSSRYAAIFLFPAILLTVFMLVKFKKWCWLLLLAMGITCCCKISRPNLKGRLLINAAEVISKDAVDENSPLVITEENDFALMSYYSAVPVCRFYENQDPVEKLRDMSRIISATAPNTSAIYFCCSVTNNAGISREDLGLDGEWELIHSVKRSKRQKLYLHIYRYRKVGTCQPLPPSGTNLIRNGNAEKIGRLNKQMLRMVKDQKISFLAGDPPFPADWILASFRPKQKFEIESSEDHPISGKKTFRLKTVVHPCGLGSSLFTLHGKAEIFFRMRGTPGAMAEISLLAYKDKEKGPRTIPLLPVKILKENQVMTYSFSFDPAEYAVKDARFQLLFQCCDGEVFFDDVIVTEQPVSAD